MKLFLLGVLSTLTVSVLVWLLVASSGIVNVSALAEHGALDHQLARISRRSIARHAEDLANPVQDDRTTRAVALLHFKANCLLCHGAPGIESAEFAKGLNPHPPLLTAESTQALSDGELFWVIANGIRMTGMPAFSPTHNDDELWKIVNLVRHLGELTESEKAQLAAGQVDESEHHEAATPPEHDDAQEDVPQEGGEHRHDGR